MKLTAFLITVFALHVSARGVSQTVTLSGKALPLKTIFSAVEKQTGYLVFYNQSDLNDTRSVTVNAQKMPLQDFLAVSLKDQPFRFIIEGKTVFLFRNDDKEAPATAKADLPAMETFQLITGFVHDQDEKPLSGVNVVVKGTTRGTITDGDGTFFLDANPENTVVISSIGYSTIEVSVATLNHMGSTASLTVKGGTIRKIPSGAFIFLLTRSEQALGEVVINNGIFTRKKESFTGSASVFTGDQLKVIGNKNIIESLKTLDPAFIKVDNNLQGSNPNSLPTLEIRGKTTLTNANLNDQFNSDPNQPLFILDGFESTLQAIYDLDMNRVASITLLKDAASTALYGSKAANGVVVVETKRPVPGKLQASYVGDYSFDLPDLSSYNLMDASENLLFEKLSIPPGNGAGANDWLIEQRASALRADVARGVNTYWLNEPVHIGFTNKQSLQLTGGNNDLIFNAGGLYSKQNGVMKGSLRENWSGNFNLTYRKGRLNITEMATASGTTANESPYGSFADFAAAKPYYRKTNADGTISKRLDPIYDTLIINPLYNASLFSINRTKSFSFINNIQGIYTFSRSFRLEGSLQMSKGNTNGVLFIPPDNTMFDDFEAHQKGSYTDNHADNNSYTGNMTLVYGTVIGKGQLNAVVRGQLESSTNEAIGFSIVGYPYGTNGNPAFAYGFTPYSTPVSSKVISRGETVTGTINYSYDRRFMFDGTYTLSGASAFGSNKMYKPFFSAGLGWDLKREKIFDKLTWMSTMKLRGNLGYAGNQNLGNFTSVSTYSFVGGNNNNFGQGLLLSSLGNPNLEWSKTFQGSYGLDFSFLNSRVSGTIEYYRKRTDPLSVAAEGTLPSSVAVNNNYVINVGNLTTKGWNFDIRYSPIYNLKDRIVWTIAVNGVKTNSVYGGISNKLSTLNKIALDSNALIRYYDGYSPDDIWAVVSRGIDPATGNELFQKKNGTLSYIYDPADIVRVGNTRPKVEGIISSSFTYKDFTLGADARYRLGGYVFNTALYNKVENIQGNVFGQNLVNVRPNLDKRALYDRWQKPGDVSEFSSITNYSAAPMSSRFVEKDNHLIGESFSLAWRSSAQWVRNLHLQTLGLSFYLNDIFRIESVQSERGLDYPFSRSASFSVNVSF